MLSQQPKPLRPVQDDYDSADDLDSSATDDHIVFQKVPTQQTKMNAHLFTTNPFDQEHSLRERTNSPDNNYAQYRSTKGYSKDANDEALKKLIYNTSPKQAANEYLQQSKIQAQSSAQQKQAKQRGNSPTLSKNYHHPFHYPQQQDINKENYQSDEQNNFVTSNFDQAPESSAYTELANKIYSQKFMNNSQARKTNVGNTVNKDGTLLLSTGAARKIEEKRYLASKEVQEDVVSRLANQSHTTNEHNRSKTSSYIPKELEECSFVPRTLDNGPKRGLDQFLHDQQQFLLQAEEKKRRLQEQALMEKSRMEPNFKPEICQNSVKILEKRNVEKTPVYQRLYNVGKNAQTKHMQGIAEKDSVFSGRESLNSSHFIGQLDTRGDVVSPTNQLTQGNNSKFIPTIHKKSKNLKRGDKIENLLYNDALRRQHKIVESSKAIKKTGPTAPLSSASKRAFATRFIKEFDIGILEFLEMDKEPKLNYLQLNEFLKKLCFLKDSEYIENPYFTPERLLLYDMWYLLHADRYKGIHRRNLLVFLLAVLDLHFPITKIQHHEEQDEEEDGPNKSMNRDQEEGQLPLADQNGNPILPEDDEHPPRERKIVGSFDEDGNYELSEEDVRRVHKIFELWHINRMCSADNIGQLIKLRNQEEQTHQPHINETSKQLAQVYREKMLGGTAELIQQNKIPPPKDGKLTHADLLIISKKVTEEKVNKFGELLKEEEVKDCTFKPSITQYDSTVSMSSLKSPQHGSIESKKHHHNELQSTTTGKARIMELYSLSKPRILKQDRTGEEVDFEKNYEECTFQPNVNLKREQNQNRQSSELYVKGIDKTVERMRQARVERDQQRNQMQRGFTTGKEGYFSFATDKRKFGNSNYIEKAGVGRGTGGASSQYRGEYNYEGGATNNLYNRAQMMREDENQETQQGYNNYEQYRNYRMEQEEQQHEGNEGNEQEYIEENPNEEEMNQSSQQQRQTHNVTEDQQGELEEGDEEEQGEEGERVPLLFVDVNLGHGRTERIIVYEGDRPDELAHRFSEEHGLDPSMKGRLKDLLDSQIAGLLSRIDEEATSAHSETERQKYGDYYNQFGQIQEEEDYNE